MKSNISEYIRNRTMSVEKGLCIIRAYPFVTNVWGVERLNLDSERLRCYAMYGVECSVPSCDRRGSFFAVEKQPHVDHEAYHLNLYGTDSKGSEYMMTVDHIVARSLGGKHTMSNTRPMCSFHNFEKGQLEQALKQGTLPAADVLNLLTGFYWAFQGLTN